MQATQSRTASEFGSEFAAKFGGGSIGFDGLRCADRGFADCGVAEGAGLAHDAGNLLGALSLYSELLAMPGVLHEEHREFAEELRLLSDRSWAMIHRLVNHARGEREMAAAAGTVLPEVVERCRGVLSRVAGRGVEVSFGVGAYEPIDSRAEVVERILTNLVKNAGESMAGEGVITVIVQGAIVGDRRRVLMTVRDMGCGMSRAAVDRLMQPGGISSTSGRGLGFRVVRELVAMSGGCLNVESEPGLGTSISVEWHAAEAVDTTCFRQVVTELAAAAMC
ncbi:HAMP domain-containing sensor histidine kinase [Edaphobacter paludis]|uniref:histidine kinase n=1 Tax=Edaphobacter paludis TaxID=3035702 RepID=A0AAU7CW27_9BACT